MVKGRSVLGERAYRLLRDEIVAGRAEPGALLPEIAVSERLGLSRTPLREAIARLAEDGLVDVVPSRPARVRPVYREEALDLVALMRMLSLRAHDLATPRLTDEQLRMIRAQTETLVDFAEGRRGDPGPLMPDEIVYEAAGSAALYDAIDRLRSRMRRLMVLSFGGHMTTSSVSILRTRADALEARDADAAVAAAKELWAEFEQGVVDSPLLGGAEQVAG